MEFFKGVISPQVTQGPEIQLFICDSSNASFGEPKMTYRGGYSIRRYRHQVFYMKLSLLALKFF